MCRIPDKKPQEECERRESQDRPQKSKWNQDVLPGQCHIFPIRVADRSCLHTAHTRLGHQCDQTQNIVAAAVVHNCGLFHRERNLLQAAADFAEGIPLYRIRHDNFIAVQSAAIDFLRLLLISVSGIFSGSALTRPAM